MIVQIDLAAFAAAGLAFSQVNGEGVFVVPPDRPGEKAATVRVHIVNGALDFFPQRHSGQKRLLGILGL